MQFVSISSRTFVALILILAGSGQLVAQQPEFSWKHYRPGNTGIQGDFCEALFVGTDGNPWIAGYEPSFEEGGFSRFLVSQNRWENFSNVDHQSMGHPEATAIIRISDFATDAFGNMWMSTGRGGLFFSPMLGPSSLERINVDNSPIHGGWSRGVEVAPDGTIWFAAYGTAWGTGGISQYNPTTDSWQIFDFPFSDGSIIVQPKPGNGYWVYVNSEPDVLRYDSSTGSWQAFPKNAGQPALVVGKNSTDPQGNTWIFKWTDPTLFQMQLDRRRPDGTWFNLPTPPFGTGVAEIRAKSENLVLVLDGSGRVWRYNGTTWSDLGLWSGSISHYNYGVDQDSQGNVWACGIGGAARRDSVTGVWQRYRVTNTSQYDYFNEDLSVDSKTGNVFAGANAGPGVGGLVKFEGKNWIGFNNHHYGLGFDWPFPADNCQFVYSRPSNGELWVNPTFDGLHRRSGTAWTNMQIGNATVNEALEDGKNRLWVVTDNALQVREGNGWRLINEVGGRKIRLDQNKRNTVWVMADTAIVRTNGVQSSTWNVEDFPELDPQSDQFKGMVVAKDGIVWIGANTINLPDNSTVIRLNPRTGQYTFFKRGQNWPFPGQYVMPLAATDDGRIWFQYDSDYGIDDQGLGFYERGSIKKFPGPFEGAMQWGGLPHSQIVDLEVLKQKDGYQLWMSCASRGIAVLTVKNQPQLLPTKLQSTK